MKNILLAFIFAFIGLQAHAQNINEKKINEFLISIIKVNCRRVCGVYSAEIDDELFYFFDDNRNFEFFNHNIRI